MAENINKFLDYSGLQILWSRIDSLFVRKESGKGLSDQNYTIDEKNKLASVAEGAQVNVIESVAVKPGDDATVGTILPMQGKTAILTMETDLTKVTADANPLHAASAMAVKDYVDGKISDVSNQITQKNVSAEGDTYVAASASGNKVTVVTSQAVKDAADKAAQTAEGDDYVSAFISNKALTVSTNVSTDIANAAANKLADAQAVKTYVEDQIAKTHVGAEGDNSLIDAEVVAAEGKGNTVKVSATQSLINAVSAANSAVQKVTILGQELTDGGSLTADQAKDALGLGSAAYASLDTAVTDNAVGAIQTKAVKSYIDDAIDEVKDLVTAATQFIGVADEAIVPGVGGTGSIIKVDSQDVEAGAGDIAMFGTSEYIWDGNKWVLLGDVTAQDQAISDINGVLDELKAKDLEIDGKINGINSSIADINSTIEENEKTTAGALNDINSRLDGVAGSAGSALQSVAGSTYIDVTDKSNNSQTISAKMQEVATADASKKGIAEASDVKLYVDGKINDLSNETSSNSTAEITKVATSVTQTAGKVTVQYTEFVALTQTEIESLCN